MTKIWHYTKLILIPVFGNLYRLIYQALANVVRFLYDFFRQGPRRYIADLRSARAGGYKIISLMRYEYDGIDGSDTFQKWPTYTKTVAGIVMDGYKGNCMDYAHFYKCFYSGKLRIYIPDLKLTKVHYLVENKGYTWELVKSGVKSHKKTARQVMEERYPNNTIYRVW